MNNNLNLIIRKIEMATKKRKEKLLIINMIIKAVQNKTIIRKTKIIEEVSIRVTIKKIKNLI